MKFNKNTRLVKIEASAIGYYSDVKAYGEIYMPEQIYEEYKDDIADMYVEISDLEKRHSEIIFECDIKINRGTLEHFVDLYKLTKVEEYKNIDDELSEQIKHTMEINDDDIDTLIDLSLKIYQLSVAVEEQFELPANTVIHNRLITKGTIIKYSVCPELPDTDVIFEIDFNEFDEQ